VSTERVIAAARALVRVFAWLRDLHARWYQNQLRWDRRVVEEDARRLGGTVKWHDQIGEPHKAEGPAQ